jgi:hypothetical protein
MEQTGAGTSGNGSTGVEEIAARLDDHTASAMSTDDTVLSQPESNLHIGGALSHEPEWVFTPGPVSLLVRNYKPSLPEKQLGFFRFGAVHSNGGP